MENGNASLQKRYMIILDLRSNRLVLEVALRMAIGNATVSVAGHEASLGHALFNVCEMRMPIGSFFKETVEFRVRQTEQIK